VAEQMLYTTVKIDTYKLGLPTGSGTGFFYRIKKGKFDAIFLITNKHVLRDSDQVTTRFHIDDDGSERKSKLWNTTFNFKEILLHPDENVDLCGINFSLTHDAMIAAGHKPKFTIVQKADIPTALEWQNLDAIEDVTMIGCPRGIYDEYNNFPIVRRGITSSNPSILYNGKSEFMVDIACFPGSSGSPIFLYNPLGYFDKGSNSYMLGNSRIKLLGILHSGPTINAKGEIILGQNPSVEISTMMHLGYAIRSSELLVLEDTLWRFISDSGVEI